MNKKIKNKKKEIKLPKFKNEDAERAYWAKFDLAKHFKKEDFVPVSFPDLKPTSRSVSLRVPEYILIRLKERANAMNVPYQSLMKRYISEGVAK